MKKFVFLSLSILAILHFTQIDALACGCAARSGDITKDVNRDFDQAAIVFSGKVVFAKFVPISEGIGATETLIIKFAVNNWWKGKPIGEVTLSTAQFRYPGIGGSGEGCEYSFEAGKKYLVYAVNRKGKLRAFDCSGTTRIENAERDIKELQKLKVIKKKHISRKFKLVS